MRRDTAVDCGDRLSLAVALGGHVHPFDDLLALTRRAEALGYDAVYVDGDATLRPSRPDAPVLDGWTVTTALLTRTERIQVGSIRLVHHWHAARLAQAAATLATVAPGRLRFLISIGGRPADRRFGLPLPGDRERIEWLDETLGALRAMWAGETVRCAGRHVTLDGARLPAPLQPPLPIEVGARRARLLEVVAAHADRWDVNLPPVRARVEAAAALLAEACHRRGRDPASIGRSLWIFHRLGPAAAARAAFRRWNPWFADIGDDELDEAVTSGSARECRARIERTRHDLGIDLPVIDLTGLPREAAEESLEALAGA